MLIVVSVIWLIHLRYRQIQEFAQTTPVYEEIVSELRRVTSRYDQRLTHPLLQQTKELVLYALLLLVFLLSFFISICLSSYLGILFLLVG